MHEHDTRRTSPAVTSPVITWAPVTIQPQGVSPTQQAGRLIKSQRECPESAAIRTAQKRPQGTLLARHVPRRRRKCSARRLCARVQHNPGTAARAGTTCLDAAPA